MANFPSKEMIYRKALEEIESVCCATDFRAGVNAMQLTASKALAAAERLPPDLPAPVTSNEQLALEAYLRWHQGNPLPHSANGQLWRSGYMSAVSDGRCQIETSEKPQVCLPHHPLDLALRFHSTYERLAPSFGYETRAETRAFDANSKNGRLMIAVCAELMGFTEQLARLPQMVAQQAERVRNQLEAQHSSEKASVPTTSASTGGTPPAPTSPVECPKCRTQLAFDDDECGLCAEES